MSDKHLVLAIFKDELTADSAAETLMTSGVTHTAAVAVLVLDEHGHLNQDKVGSHSVGKGMAIGGLLFLLGPGALGVGLAAGAAAGALHHKSLGLSDEDKERLTSELAAGKAAVGVLADHRDATEIATRLQQLGGTAEAYELSDEAAQAAAEQTAPA